MIVSIKSQCGKKALIETRRILDQFFERAGDRCWEGAITLDGLIMVRKLLRKTARRNTAVVCHRIRGARQLELEWIVGNARLFNAQGKIPANRTGRDVLKSDSENQWHTAEAIALMAGIAGLFHDFGKANALFQKKLQGQHGMQEPLRHEWLSLLMFVAFVRGKTDQEWLEALAQVRADDDQSCQDQLTRFRQNRDDALKNPFGQLEGMPLAQTIGWLIVSHHRLPIYAEWADLEGKRKRPLEKLTLADQNWGAFWNSPQYAYKDWKTEDWHSLFSFAKGTPMASQQWRTKAKQLAQRALKQSVLSNGQTDWLQQDQFTSHLARLALMLADHSYSAADKQTKWWDDSYQVYANTDKPGVDSKRPLKQRLDEHNIGVGQNALLLARQLPNLRSNLPVLVSHKTLKARSKISAFRWQDKAFDLASGLSAISAQQGFFGVNMASTGKGKTFANARIMYGLACEQPGCRFSVALGLRTLTLQTGDALKERLKLDSDELAVLVGSQAVQELHRRRNDSGDDSRLTAAETSGSESSEDLLDDTQHVSYDGTLSDGPLRRWLGQKKPGQTAKGKPAKSLQLLSAPVLVCTIDHLMPATEGVRGGKQITPMLRLLTSDLVLDEPDDFDSADLPALCRLVNWAGLLGSRVLLSSASMPPAMLTALFSAYRAGRAQFDKACGTHGQVTEVCCAWFDEFGSTASQCVDQQVFKAANAEFVAARVKHLQPDLQPGKALRCAEVLDVNTENSSKQEVINAIRESCWQGMTRLHQAHAKTDPKTGKRVSVGLIRMANINPLVALAKQLIEGDIPDDTRLHLCVYHSQHPLLVRSHIEKRLDHTLNRKQPEDLWQQPEIRAALDAHPEQNHLFVVLGSPVTEVGRDHDYDWAIAEPSSMRSLIQLAGRVQRHRKQPPEAANMLVLNYNYLALKYLANPNNDGQPPRVYTRPGFEAQTESGTKAKTSMLKLEPDYWAIHRCVDSQDLEAISSIPRIVSPKKSEHGTNLLQIEHLHLVAALFDNPAVTIKGRTPADRWWRLQPSADWHAEMQRRTPFRKSTADEAYVLYQEDELEEPVFYKIREVDGLLLPGKLAFDYPKLTRNAQCSPWLEIRAEPLIAQLSEDLSREVSDISRQFCEVRLRCLNDTDSQTWQYHPWLGIFHEIHK